MGSDFFCIQFPRAENRICLKFLSHVEIFGNQTMAEILKQKKLWENGMNSASSKTFVNSLAKIRLQINYSNFFC